MLNEELNSIFNECNQIIDWLQLLIENCSLWQRKKLSPKDEKAIFMSKTIENLLQVNEYNDVIWYREEKMTELISILEPINYLHYLLNKDRNQYDWRRFRRLTKKWKIAHMQSDCKMRDFLENISEKISKISEKKGGE